MALALCGLIFAFAAATAQAQTIAPESAKKFIQGMGDRTVSALAMQGDPRKRNDAFTNIMLEAIDFDALALATMGRMARTVGPADRLEFTRLFAAHVIDVAIEKFGSIQINKFDIAGIKQMPNGDAMVRTLIDRAGDRSLSADWRVHDAKGAAKINDIEIEGYSLVIHYRGEFERANVSTVPGLIGKLREMTRDSAALPVTRQTLK